MSNREQIAALVAQVNLHKKLAADFCDAADYVQSAHHGSLSLTAESELVCARADISINVLSFSLFGNDPLYCETAILNARALPEVYPDWQMRVYHDETVPEHVLQRLRAHQVQLFDVRTIGIAHWPGTFWRFHACTDAHIARVQFRDADSIISVREAQWVSAWETSKLPFHVLRDWYSHTDLILAGLWGAHAPLLAHMGIWVEEHLKATPTLHPTHADQQFLAQIVWPKIAPYCLTHDTAHELAFATPIDSPRPGAHSSDALGGFKAKHLSVTVPEQVTQYLVTLTDEQQRVVMQYQRSATNGTDEFHIPTEYYQHVESGLWKIAYMPLPNLQVQIQKAPPSA